MTHTRPHSAHMHTGRAHDLLADAFFVGQRRRVYKRLATLSRAHPGDQVLDVGCGDGHLTRLMAEMVAPDGAVLGVDPSGEAVRRAQQATREANCTFDEGTAQALAPADRSVDVVVSSLMLHHLPEADQEQAVAEMFRVLRPGGRLLVAEFRPPTTRIVRWLIRPIASSAMQHNPIHLLEPLIAGHSFQQTESGELHPWIHYVRAIKP